jgi:phage terminase large subunit-like protein
VKHEYRPGQCHYCHAATWVETRANGTLQCRGCKVVAFFRWMYSFIGFTVLEWQERELRTWFGTVDPATGLRKYRRIYDEKPKKNGKSFLIGGLPIYHLIAEDVRKPEAYGAAATMKSADAVFKSAVELIEANRDLKKRLRVLKANKRILLRDATGFYQVVSTEPKSVSGVEPSLLFIDELHRWSGQKAEDVWSELWGGQISRPEPLGIMTTTAGSEDESLLWNTERDFAKSVIAGEIQSPNYYASICQADERRVAEEPGYWESREARVQANPSHEDNGGFLQDSALVGELTKALQQGKKNEYLRYHLGIRVTGTRENAIDIPQWIASNEASGVDLRQWPAYDKDINLLISRWGLAERPAVIGIDASWSIDLSAVSVVFPPIDTDIWKLLLFYFMPKAQIEKRQKIDQVPYEEWARRGFIEACEGNAIDYDAIKARVRWACEMFDVREIGYDKWNFRATAMDLADEGLPMAEVSQNFSQLTEPTKTLLGAYQDAKLWHGNNPVLLFNARSLALQYDRKDNVQPAKPERLKSKKRIDGIAATITAMNRAMQLVHVGPSPWASVETAVM